MAHYIVFFKGVSASANVQDLGFSWHDGANTALGYIKDHRTEIGSTHGKYYRLGIYYFGTTPVHYGLLPRLRHYTFPDFT